MSERFEELVKETKDEVMRILDIAKGIVDETEAFGYKGHREQRISVFAVAHLIQKQIENRIQCEKE